MKVLMPQLGETVAEGTVALWHKKVGDQVAVDDILADVETDKAAIEIPAAVAGVLKSILVLDGDTVEVGTVLAVIDDGSTNDDEQGTVEPAALAPIAATEPVTPATEPVPVEKVAALPSREAGQRLSPVVRRLLREHDMQPGQINGTGRDGRVTRNDVLTAIASSDGESRLMPGPAAAPVAAGGERIPFNRIRRVTAEHMVASKATSPHVLQAVEVDFSQVNRARNAARDAWRSQHGYSLTFLPFIAHAACTALKEFPNLNASVEDDALVIHPQVGFAIAVDLGDDGLVAPVVAAADTLSVAELSHRIRDVSERARSGKLTPDEFSGGTYTISNSGTFGTLITAPIINQPQVAILSMDGIRKRPVVVEGPAGDALAIRPVGILAQSFDHRAVDGAYSAAFLARVREILEQTDWSIRS
jgi:2-oxoglutarate dehydrogenase E2 component (dihydrolipoamide succinyltransferase)